MVLPSCRRCGETDPRRMVGLMTLWFGSFIELEPAHGYFYLCPSCYHDHVAAHLEDMQETLARLHPSTAALHHHEEPEDATAGPEDDSAAAAGSGAETEPAEDRSGALENATNGGDEAASEPARDREAEPAPSRDGPAQDRKVDPDH